MLVHPIASITKVPITKANMSRNGSSISSIPLWRNCNFSTSRCFVFNPTFVRFYSRQSTFTKNNVSIHVSIENNHFGSAVSICSSAVHNFIPFLSRMFMLNRGTLWKGVVRCGKGVVKGIENINWFHTVITSFVGWKKWNFRNI